MKIIPTGLLFLSVALIAFAQPTPSPADLAQLIAQDAAYIKSAFAKPKVEKKAQGKIRLAALLIAQYAQSSMAKDGSKALASLRDRALGVLSAVEAGKLDDARKLAEKLSPDAAVEPGVKTAPIALDKKLSIALFMAGFAGERQGGFGLEDRLDELAKLEGPISAEDAAKIQAYARKVAMIGLLTQGYAPAKDEGKKSKMLWVDTSKDMQAAAMELADAAKSKQGAAVVKAAEKLSASCTRCHEVFR